MPSTTPPLTVPTPNSIPIDNKEWIKKLLESIIDGVNGVNGVNGGGNGSGNCGSCGNGGGNCGSCVNGGYGGGGGGNDDYIDTNEYKELIIVYIQVIKTCKSIYKKFINMH
jgi:hypothetical protein